MKAQQLVASASFEPEALMVVGKAFDLAWRDIAQNFGENSSVIEAARLRLAHAMLAVAKNESRDVVELKNAALEVFALAYRLGRGE